MRKHKDTLNAITVCVEKEHILDVHEVISKQIDTIGIHEVYLNGNNAYIGIETTLHVSDVAKVFKTQSFNTKIVGGLIFIRF